MQSSSTKESTSISNVLRVLSDGNRTQSLRVRLQRPGMNRGIVSSPVAAASAMLASTFFSPSTIAQSVELSGATLPERSSVVADSIRKPPISIPSISGLARVWNAGEPLYVRGEQVASATELAQLRSWLIDHNAVTGAHWTVVLVKQSAGYHYEGAPWGSRHGADAMISELRDRLTSQAHFSQLLDQATNEANGALLFISLDGDGVNRRLVLWTKELYEHYGVGHSSELFRDQVFPAATALIANEGRVCDAVKQVVSSLDSALTTEQQAGFHLTEHQKLLLAVGAVLVVFTAISVAAARAARNGSYNSGNSTFVYFGDVSSGGGDCGGCCGGGDCGGGSF